MWDLFHLVTLEFAEDLGSQPVFLGLSGTGGSITMHSTSYMLFLHMATPGASPAGIFPCFSRFPSPCGHDISEAVDLFLAHTEKRLLHMTPEDWMTWVKSAIHQCGFRRIHNRCISRANWSLHHSIALFPTSIKQQVKIKSMLTTITSNPQSKCVTLWHK